jgi:ADP-ribose pyrophosphatase
MSDDRIQQLGAESIYQDDYVRIRRDQVRFPGGREGHYAVVTVKPGVSILAIDEDNQVYLIREHKYVLGGINTEVVGGAIEPGETPLAAAHRELREEAGLIARDWAPMGTMQPLSAIVQCPIHLFVARGLEHCERRLDDSEALDVIKTPFRRAVEMVLQGEITQAASCVLILKSHALRNQELI